MEKRYQIIGEINQGSIGKVYRAYDTKMCREVAIKRLLDINADAHLKDEVSRKLMQQGGDLASLQHPNIVTVYDVDSDEGGPYIVLEWVKGETLAEILVNSNTPLTWEAFKMLTVQLLEAFMTAQSRNVLHGDLQPSNIVITKLPSGTFQVKILDFGLSHLIHTESQANIAEMKGDPKSIFFMAPEQFDRDPLDARSDIYSLGCCLYLALTLDHPFQGETHQQVMISHLTKNIKPIEEYRDDIPTWACQWLMWLINRSRNDRPSTAADALSNFQQMDDNRKGSHPAHVSEERTLGSPVHSGQTASLGKPTTVSLNEKSGIERVKQNDAPGSLFPHGKQEDLRGSDLNRTTTNKVSIFGNISDMPLPEILSIVGRGCGKFIILNHPSGSPIELHTFKGNLLGMIVNGVHSSDVLNARSQILSLIRQPEGDFEFHKTSPSELVRSFETPLHQLLMACSSTMEEIDSYQDHFPNPFTLFILSKSRDAVWLDEALAEFYEMSLQTLKIGSNADRLARISGMHVDQVRLYLFKLRSAGLVRPLRQLEQAANHSRHNLAMAIESHSSRNMPNGHAYSPLTSSRTVGQDLTHVRIADRKSFGLFQKVSGLFRKN